MTRPLTTDEVNKQAEKTISEKQLQQWIIGLARTLGWRVYHPWSSMHSESGWPDLAMVRHGRFLVAELKSARDQQTPAQRDWLMELMAAGIETHVWRPDAWLDGTIERVLVGERLR